MRAIAAEGSANDGQDVWRDTNEVILDDRYIHFSRCNSYTCLSENIQDHIHRNQQVVPGNLATTISML